MGFTFKETNLPGVILITPRVFQDDRGHFFESYKRSVFAIHGITEEFVQENHSFSKRGVLRGLHYQLPPHAQGKLVTCFSGNIFDVAIDIRRNSPHFRQWVALDLSGANKNLLYIPPGFAHGFYTLSDTAQVVYKVTAEYAPNHERGIIWNDPELDIQWPSGPVILSERDKKNPVLQKAKIF